MSEKPLKLTSGQKAAHMASFNAFKKSLEILRAEFIDWHNELRSFHGDLFIDSDDRKSKKNELSDLVESINQSQQNINAIELDLNDAHIKISGNDENIGLLAEIENIGGTLRKNTAESNTQLEEINLQIYGETSEAGEKLSDGFISKLGELEQQTINALDFYKTESQKKLQDIDSILAGATNVELAKGFEIQKNNARTSKWIWSSGFILSISSMACLGYWFYASSADSGPLAKLILESATIATKTPSIGILTFLWLASFLQKLVIYVPLLWFALKCSRNQSQSARFEAEYAHKESIAITYNGHKSQLSEFSDEDAEKLKAALAANLIEAVAFNPSVTLENKYHGENDSVITKLLSKLPNSKEEPDLSNQG